MSKSLWIQTRRGRLQLTLNAKLNYPPNDRESLQILEQKNDVSEAVFLADESGAHTCFEVGEEPRGDPIDRPVVRGRAWPGEDDNEEIKEQIKGTFKKKKKSTGLEFEFGSIKEILRCLGACWYRNEIVIKGSSWGEGEDESMGHLRESLHSKSFLVVTFAGGVGGAGKVAFTSYDI